MIWGSKGYPFEAKIADFVFSTQDKGLGRIYLSAKCKNYFVGDLAKIISTKVDESIFVFIFVFVEFFYDLVGQLFMIVDWENIRKVVFDLFFRFPAIGHVRFE